MLLLLRKTGGERPRGGGCTCLLLLLLLLLEASLPLVSAKGFPDIPGDFCRNRKPSECCEDRYDDCSVPILGTLCYCDEFCLVKDADTVHDDCCPDFREVCLGERPEEKPSQDDPGQLHYSVCEKDGVRLLFGTSYKFNCNTCWCEKGGLVCEEDQCMVDEDVIEEVNFRLRQYGWRATNYSSFWGRKTKDGLLLRTGTLYPQDLSTDLHPIKLSPDVSSIPQKFDARTEPRWQGRIGGVADQGWCGASWAFSTMGVIQDRISIVAKGLANIQLSAQNLLSCAKLGQNGCDGGYIDRAWHYLRRVGVVLEECYQYESGASGKVPKCLIHGKDTSNLECEHKYQYKSEPAYRISSKEEDIQWEILTNGPVQAMMEVHSDLFMYKSGVYSYSGLAGQETASHSVKIIGWGEAALPDMEPVKYWVVSNSWGTEWGERGHFRIRRGINELGIESFIIAVRPRLANYVYGGTEADIRT
ncbi:uncharacterized peptidase C1-like protein F26E4.3 [Cherax quadricarinatus]|uniref:uncharacterized peptidase C1-like protein F26E4.3 n=1 Tax=Cherax quadricarinatus TaxID=27406 RepID=UPI00387EC2A0